MNQNKRTWKQSSANLTQNTLFPFFLFASILAFLSNQFLLSAMSLCILFLSFLNDKMFAYMTSSITIQSEMKKKRYYQINDEFPFLLHIKNEANFKINFDLRIIFNDNISLPMESGSTIIETDMHYQTGVLRPGVNEIKIPMVATKRGSVSVEELTIHITSFFGLEKRSYEYQKHVPETYFIYPKIRRFNRPNAQMTTNYGSGSAPYGLLQDRMSVVGHQDYMSSHSIRDIDWNATAKLNKMQAKTYDSSVNNAQFFLIDISKGFGYSKKMEEYLEMLTNWVVEAEKVEIPYGFAINAQSQNSRFYHLEIGNGEDHKEKALALIATIPNSPYIVDFPKVLAVESRYQYLVSNWYHIGNKGPKIESIYKKIVPLSKVEFIN
jgi:uncharacterized protein (DUF58 family)